MDSIVDLAWISKDSGIPLSTIHHFNRTGVGPPSYKVGRRYLVRRADYDAWLSALQSSSGDSSLDSNQIETEN